MVADADRRATRSCRRSSSPRRPRRSASTARSSASTTSRRQLASPFPLLAAIARADEPHRDRAPASSTCATRTRSTWPRRRRRPTSSAAAGCSSASAAARPSPRCAARRRSATCPREGQTDADLARAKTELFRAAIAGAGVARSDPAMTGVQAMLPIQPQSPGLPERIWWGAGHARDRGVGGRAGHEPDELDAADRGHRRRVRRAAGRADRDVPRRLGGRRLGARAARLGEPQRHADRRPTSIASTSGTARGATARTRSATSTAGSRGSGAATSASRT